MSEFSSTSQPPSGPSRTKTSGTTGVTGSAAEGQARLGIERADFRDHVGDVFGIHAAERGQLRHVAARHQIEPGQQRLPSPDRSRSLAFSCRRQAFRQVARAHAHRIEALHHAQHRLDVFQLACPAASAISVESARR